MTVTVLFGQRENMAGCHSWNTIPVKTLCSVVCLLLLFTTASSVDSCDSRMIQLPPSYIINGTDYNLRLTCNVIGATEFDFKYNVSGLFSKMPCQEIFSSMNTCTYKPTLATADYQVRCSARVSSAAPVDVFCTPDIQYPPETAPVINTTRAGPLQQGDVVTCSVSGGRPPNTTINFSCSDMQDQPDVTNNVTVSSNVTMGVSGQESLTCICTADWNPQPGLYNGNATKTCNMTFTDLASFTINNSTSMDATINQSVVLNCAARGRPAPNVTLYRPLGDKHAIYA